MQIDGYDLHEKIASDGVVSVYSARRLKDDVPVSIQVLVSQQRPDDLLRRKMQKEFRRAATVDSPYVLKYLDYIENREVTAIVTEQRPALNLRARLSLCNGLSLEETIQIGRQIASGLYDCHCCGIVHRQVTPENIFITHNKNIKIANFGLAGIVNATTLTMTGAIIGAPEYVPPEYLYSAPKDVRSDIYSLGIIIWEMLIGQNPFEGENLTDIFKEKNTHPLPAPSAVNPEIPRWMDILLAEMTAPDLNDRPKSLQQVIIALEKRFHMQPARQKTRGNHCLACGYPVPAVLWFCPYCGQSDPETRRIDPERSVLLIKEADNIKETTKFLAKTFGEIPESEIKKRNRKKTDIPVIENITASESCWLTERLQDIGCRVELKPMSAWYFKITTLAFFFFALAIMVLFRPLPSATPSSMSSLFWGFKLTCFGALIAMGLYCLRLHYASPREIPLKWLEGTFTYDPFSGYLLSADRILSSIVLTLATLFILGWASITCLAIFDFLQIQILKGSWGALVVDNSFLLLLAQLVIIKLFAGDIYTPVLFDQRRAHYHSKIRKNTDFQLFERLRKLVIGVPDTDFRYLIAECLEHRLYFNRLKMAAAAALPEDLLDDLEERFLAALESVSALGKEVRKYAEPSSEAYRQGAEKKDRLVKYHIEQSFDKPSASIMDEWKKAQDMILNHEVAVEMTARHFNNIRLIVGSMHTVTLQLLPAGHQNKAEQRDIELGLTILSEALNAVAVQG